MRFLVGTLSAAALTVGVNASAAARGDVLKDAAESLADAGALMSTVDDPAKFRRALFDGTLLGAAEIAAMTRTVVVDEVSMGLGVDRIDVPCAHGEKRRVWGNSGAGPGYNSYSLISEDGSRQQVIAMNVSDLADDVAGRPAIPEGASLLPAMMGVFC